MTNETNDFQIFMSYTVADKSKVLPIYDFLLANGYTNTWIDCKNLLPGQLWDNEIKRNLRKSDIIIIFISNQGEIMNVF